jgi:hypothetical protein
MTPLPTNPNVVILVNAEGKVEAVATNVAPELNVTVTTNPTTYNEAALGKPFNTARPN